MPRPTPHGAIIRLQGAKHRAFLALKPYRWEWYSRTEPLARRLHALRPYRYDPADFAGTFVVDGVRLTRDTVEPLPRRIFAFWTGSNPLTHNRQQALESLRSVNPDVEVLLVAAETLGDWEVPGHPFHHAYGSLSLIHRSDYLRAYFLHHHGGGYADIKRSLQPWSPVFDRMDASAAWMGGYPVPVRLMTPNMADPRLDRLMRRCSEVRLGPACYLARPRTPLTTEWVNEVERRMDAMSEALVAHPGDARGANPGYPVGFNSLLAQVLDPLQVKYSTHLLHDERLVPDHENYL